MKKAVLSHRIYLSVDEEMKRDLEKELTYKIPPPMPDGIPIIIKNMGRVRKDLVTIPIGRTDLIPLDYEIVEKRVLKPVDFPEFRFDLRESQQAVYNELEDSAMINAWVSWGKTFCALAIAGKLSQKTLVIVHNVSLRDQWVREVEKVYGFTPGIIGSGKFDISTPIVIGNTQSLYKKIFEIQKEFGTIIMDEFHHCPSPTFSKIIDTNYARYKIGLSGTLERKDGKHVVFRDYFGSKIFKPPKENFMIPSVDLISTEIPLPPDNSWARRVNSLLFNPEYQHLVAMLAAIYAKKGHTVLVVGDRVEFLKNCAKLVGESAICVTGEDKGEDREKLIASIASGEKNVLFGTQSIFSEGISVNNLSCLILGTPINNEPLLTQLVGRVIRKAEGKLDPKIVDIQVKGYTAVRQAKARLGYYMREGYKISKI